MTRVVSIISGKGGVGKTTFSTNLAVSLAEKGERVALLDGDLTGANVSRHFGLDASNATINDVVRGDAYITQAIYRHKSGLSVLPADFEDHTLDSNHLKHAILDFLGQKDFVIIDSPPGAGGPVRRALESSNEALIVSKPSYPAVDNAKVVKKLANEVGVDIRGVVLNQVYDDHLELRHDVVAEKMGEEIIGEIPQCDYVREAIAHGKPVLHHKPYSKAVESVDDVTYKLIGREPPKKTPLDKVKKGFLRFLDG